MVVMWFSRQREFRADVGGARLAGRENMIRALERLRRRQPANAQPCPTRCAPLASTAARAVGFARLFMSHPPLEERIAALRAMSR
jgi:heat shock protein HtpX